jgi:hypothetical protein
MIECGHPGVRKNLPGTAVSKSNEDPTHYFERNRAAHVDRRVERVDILID